MPHRASFAAFTVLNGITVGGIIAAILMLVVNVGQLQLHTWQVLKGDPRNTGMIVLTYYRYGVIPNQLVFDVWTFGETTSPADVTRVLLEVSAKLKKQTFNHVFLSFKGEPRFMMKGDYFQRLGQEYATQNPLYTIRTMPEHIYHTDGRPAFETWTGGWLGVFSNQLEDFNTFHRQWYFPKDLLSSPTTAD